MTLVLLWILGGLERWTPLRGPVGETPVDMMETALHLRIRRMLMLDLGIGG